MVNFKLKHSVCAVSILVGTASCPLIASSEFLEEDATSSRTSHFLEPQAREKLVSKLQEYFQNQDYLTSLQDLSPEDRVCNVINLVNFCKSTLSLKRKDMDNQEKHQDN